MGALRRAELSFEQRCANLQANHESRCLLLYAKVRAHDAAMACDMSVREEERSRERSTSRRLWGDGREADHPSSLQNIDAVVLCLSL